MQGVRQAQHQTSYNCSIIKRPYNNLYSMSASVILLAGMAAAGEQNPRSSVPIHVMGRGSSRLLYWEMHDAGYCWARWSAVLE